MGSSTLKRKTSSKPSYVPATSDVVEHVTNGKIAIITQSNNVTQMVKVTVIHDPNSLSMPVTTTSIVQDWDYNSCKKFIDGEVIIKN